MRKEDAPMGEEPLIDTTQALQRRSKRTERAQKKRHLKQAASKQHATLNSLPTELLHQILRYLRPSSIFPLIRTSRGLRTFILTSQSQIATSIIAFRYPALTKCFPLPHLLSNVDSAAHPALLDEERQSIHLNVHKKPYQHIRSPDPHLVCTCLTCILAWNNLCLIVDFAHWQPNLNTGEPLPILPRGKRPLWNETLISTHSSIIETALIHPLWYARILEEHLKSTIGSILRHSNNAGNKRKRFRMDREDVRRGDDAFLERSGPPTVDFPFHRDNYYMLEAYLPNRCWLRDEGRWGYVSGEQHERDVEFVREWNRRKEREMEKERERMEEEGRERV